MAINLIHFVNLDNLKNLDDFTNIFDFSFKKIFETYSRLTHYLTLYSLLHVCTLLYDPSLFCFEMYFTICFLSITVFFGFAYIMFLNPTIIDDKVSSTNMYLNGLVELGNIIVHYIPPFVCLYSLPFIIKELQTLSSKKKYFIAPILALIVYGIIVWRDINNNTKNNWSSFKLIIHHFDRIYFGGGTDVKSTSYLKVLGLFIIMLTSFYVNAQYYRAINKVIR